MLLRRAGRVVLVAAMAATITAVIDHKPPLAHADDTVLQSPPIAGSGTPGGLTVNDLGGGTVTVTNPGGTVPTTQQCLTTSADDFCLGTSDKTQNESDVDPISISGYASQPKGLSGGSMDYFVDEATAAVAAEHGVKADDAVAAYGRPEIRAYLVGRIEDVLNKKLYGKTLTPQEDALYDELQATYKQKQVDSARWALDEYNRWSADPCAYVPPAPPAGSGLSAVPNDVRTSSDCNLPNSPSKLFKFTNNTPPASTFDTWASYRHPTPSMTNANNAAFKQMTVNTISGIVVGAGIAGAVTAGFSAAAGVTLAASIVAANSAVAALLDVTVTTTSVLTSWLGALGASAAAFAGVITSVLIGIVIGAVAIYQLVEDAKPGQDLAERARNAAANDDPLDIESHVADYAGLNMAQLQDPTGKPKSAIHTADFAQQLVAQVNEWMMFTQRGNLIADPTGSLVNGAVPGFPADPTTSDYKFIDTGVEQPYIQLLAVNGAVGNDGTTAISGYRVRISRGWLMVAEVKQGGAVGPFLPRLSVDYVAPDGTKGRMTLVHHTDQSGDPKVDILLSVPQPNGATKVVGTIASTWSFKNTAVTTRTVSLQTAQPVLPQVNVLPSAEGDMGADHNVTLKANASSPADSASNKQYTWTLQRLASDGTVAETIDPPAGNLTGFQHRFTTPGRYRAQVTLTGNNPGAFTASGRVEFTIRDPEPQVQAATVQDDRVLDGKLFLNLRMLQNTRSDDFTVKVDWATDTTGTPVSDTYTVHCEDTGFDTCDTGPLVSPDSAPTNSNWSKSPSFRIPDGQNYLPYVNVTITNGYGQTIQRTFPITPGDERPKYADDNPYVAMPVGADTTQDVVEVFPATLPAGNDQTLTIQPFFDDIVDQLPPGVLPDLTEENGHWFLQLKGTPAADSIGTYTIYFPFEQNPIGSGITPPPATVTLEVKAAVQPGYRAILRGVPAEFTDRSYRNVYPGYTVQVAQVLGGSATTFTPFTGTVHCKLVSGPNVVFDKTCAQDKPFPWPTERITDAALHASVYVTSASQPVSADGPYDVAIATRFLNTVITTTTPAANALRQTFTLKLDDNGFILAPYTGYTVTCSFDKAAYKPCFTNGTQTLTRTPGTHTIDVKAVKPAPNAATTTTRYTWTVATPAKALGLAVPAGKHKRGKAVTITGSKLLPGETYVIKIGGIVVARGKASATGTISRKVVVPKRLKAKKYNVVLTGANAKRNAIRTITLK